MRGASCFFPKLISIRKANSASLLALTHTLHFRPYLPPSVPNGPSTAAATLRQRSRCRRRRYLPDRTSTADRDELRRPDAPGLDLPDVDSRPSLMRSSLIFEPILLLPNGASHHHSDHGSSRHSSYWPVHGGGSASDPVQIAWVRV